MTVTPNLFCKRGDTYGFDLAMPNNLDGSLPDITGASCSWGVYRDAYTSIVYLYKTNLPISTRTENGVQYAVVSVDLTPDDTASLPAGDLYHEAKIVLADETIHSPDGIFRVLPSPNP